jgi:hypothetical protein
MAETPYFGEAGAKKITYISQVANGNFFSCCMYLNGWQKNSAQMEIHHSCF